MEKEDFAFGSAIDALDQIASAPRDYFSKVGFERLSKLSRDLASLRRRVSGSLIETLLEAERYLFLDSEVVINNQSAIGRKHLDQFLDEASKFARNGGTLNSFLDWLKIADEQESGIKVSSVNVTNQAVQILTIHAAKGLEWEKVYLVGASDGTLPWRGESIEEERRLFYVGITRARKTLALSYAGVASPFLRDAGLLQ